jgi:hypothetical protein
MANQTVGLALVCCVTGKARLVGASLTKFQFCSPNGGRTNYSFHPDSPRKDEYTVGGVVNGQCCSLWKIGS